VFPLFQQSFQYLHRAVDRIATQLQSADPSQRTFLFEELTALRHIGERFLESWMDFQDKVQDVTERYQQAEDVPTDMPSDQEAPTFLTVIKKPDDVGALGEDIGQALFHDSGERWFRRGLGYFDLLMYKEAMSQFEQILELDENMTVARLYLALSYIGTQRFEEAERHLRVIIRTARDAAVCAAAHDARAQLYAQSGRLHDAQSELLQTISIRPDYLDAHLNLALCAYSAHDYIQSLRYAQHALTLDADEPVAWRVTGAASFALGRSKEALTAYLRVYELTPLDTDVQVEIGKIYIAMRKPSQARLWFNRVASIRRCYGDALIGLIDVALLEQDYEKAILLAKKQISLERDVAPAWLRLGWALIGQGEFERAEKLFETFHERYGVLPQTLSGQARILVARGERQQAKSLLRQLLQMDNAEARAHGFTEFGRMYLEAGEMRKAIRCFQGALAIDRRHEDALLGLGAAKQALHEPTRY